MENKRDLNKRRETKINKSTVFDSDITFSSRFLVKNIELEKEKVGQILL